MGDNTLHIGRFNGLPIPFPHAQADLFRNSPPYHWYTKDNAAVISGSIETELHRFLRNRVSQSPGVLFHAIGGTDDHLHLAVSAPPTLLVSDWVGELKGASAYYINHRVANQKLLAWQAGYGVVSFGRKAVPWVVRYIENQRRHHAAGTTSSRLERITSETSDTEKPIKTG